MNVLVISSILPVPGYIANNDYVPVLNNSILKANKNIVFTYVRPSPYLPFLRTGKWYKRWQVCRLKKYKSGNIIVNILPYVAVASNSLMFLLSSFLLVFTNRKRLKKFSQSAELIHAHYIFPDGLISNYLKKKYNIPYILTLQSEQRIFNNKISSFFAGRILSNADKVVAISPLMRDFLLEKDILKNIQFIGLGIDKSFFKTQQLKNKRKDEIRILSIGALYRLKNYENQICAIGALKGKYNITFTIVGSGEDETKLKKLVNDLHLNQVINFISHIENDRLADFMKTFDIFMLASKKETWGRVYLEAMAVGLPVILTANTGVYGIVKENSDALVVDPDDVKDITSKLESLILHPEERSLIAENGKKLASDFSWNNIAKQYLEIYNV